MSKLMAGGQSVQPEWKEIYSFKKEYNVDSLSPSSVAEIIGRMEADVEGSEDLTKYVDHFYTGRPPKCDKSCRVDMLCNLNYTVFDDIYACDKNNGGPKYGFSEILNLILSRVDPDYMRKFKLFNLF